MATKRKSYSELLKDYRWETRRQQILQRDGRACTRCTCSQKILHVHHLYYVAGRMPWNYPNFALQTLCEDCHERACVHDPEEFEEWEEICSNLNLAFNRPTHLYSFGLLFEGFVSAGGDAEEAVQVISAALLRHMENQNITAHPLSKLFIRKLKTLPIHHDAHSHH